MPALKLRYQILIYILTGVFAGLSFISVLYPDFFPMMAEVLFYTLAASAFFLSCFYIAGTLVRLKQVCLKILLSHMLSAPWNYEGLLAYKKFHEVSPGKKQASAKDF